MDPLTVLKTMWTHKWVTIPLVLITVLACAYGLLWAPRSYESRATFALAMPSVPSEEQLQDDPELAAKNADNPYLRWRDTSLLAQVVIARVNSTEVGEKLEERGLASEFELMPPDGTSSGMMNLTVEGATPEVATETVAFLSEEFTRIMREVQKINEADDLYLIEALPISGPTPAQEVFSSRLRFTAILGVAGMVLLFGAVSLAESIAASRRRTRPAPADAAADRHEFLADDPIIDAVPGYRSPLEDRVFADATTGPHTVGR
ncbi:hypothetical protein [Citricoccus muralis]|uniref:Capsular polysaccharide biosynthesis protein n=1 Tax=Citricoccus muralis TaxID=169134 RepID=A0A3D9L7T1_9MICC|nr:hypothetical protein [Citricoccus muralis]REE02409.1 hypothetical protein C8E99_0178 [Citricoccus muralis]